MVAMLNWLIALMFRYVYGMSIWGFLDKLDGMDYHYGPLSVMELWVASQAPAYKIWRWTQGIFTAVRHSRPFLAGLHGKTGQSAMHFNPGRYPCVLVRAIGRHCEEVTLDWDSGFAECVSMERGERVITKMRIGKVLSRIILHYSKEVEAACKENAPELVGYQADQVREWTRIKRLWETRTTSMTWRISCDPRDVLTMSHNRPWSSCQGPFQGYAGGPMADVLGGTAVMFFYPPGGEEPCGRWLIRAAISPEGEVVLKVYNGTSYGTCGKMSSEELEAALGIKVLCLAEEPSEWRRYQTTGAMMSRLEGCERIEPYLDGGSEDCASKAIMELAPLFPHIHRTEEREKYDYWKKLARRAEVERLLPILEDVMKQKGFYQERAWMLSRIVHRMAKLSPDLEHPVPEIQKKISEQTYCM